MNVKVIAVVVIVVVVAAGLGVFFLHQNMDKDKEINVISGVNTEGSGIFIKKSIDINTMFDFSTSVPTPKSAGWQGKVFSTPGTSSIQHIQILTIVEEMGMSFTLYTGSTSAPNTVYFITNIANAVAALGQRDIIDGGILWQPQYQKVILDPGFKKLALTNDLFPGHACCVVAGYHGYTASHENETVKFLAAIIKATDWVNEALKTGSGEDYDLLITVALRVAGNNFDEAEIKDALETVTYYNGEKSSTPLIEIKGQMAVLAKNLERLGVTANTLEDLGFSSGTQFVNKFADERFIVKAHQLIDGSGGTSGGGKLTNLRVAVIGGDIHQIAVHIAKELGYFKEYGLNVTFSTQLNGAGVATAIQNGDSSFGLLGAPPLTITVINGELVKA
ncbi:MAG: ABC transporter substrate-binding protein [Candidatus Methanoplasma sp.]|jgi:ABC-type nitrate/sulfonate/bicarbonate transport system substrate-binding protein|nr:ABC transporter substrate-binding protein [Candidatus Methanoplasma sp.]